MWTLQNDDVLTANAASYVDDYLQANGSELFFDTALLCADAPYPDLYGARVDWELLLHREYELAMQTQQAGILPDVYTPPVIGPDEQYFSVPHTSLERVGTLHSSPLHCSVDEKADLGLDDRIKTATTTFPWDCTKALDVDASDHVALLSNSAFKAFSDLTQDEREVWVSPKDLLIGDGNEKASVRARQQHDRDLSRNYLRAEQEIATIRRRIRPSTTQTTKTTKRKSGILVGSKMDLQTYSNKRPMTTTEQTSSPNRKRAKTSPRDPSPPKLWLDCTFESDSLPFQSSATFSIHSSATFTSCSQSGHSSASIHQVLEYPQTYNLPQQSYAPQNPPPRYPSQSYPPQSYPPPQPPCRSPVASYWNMFPGFHPAWPHGVPYGASNNFANNCQSSIYSGLSAGSGHPGNFPSATITERPKQSGDARDTLIKDIVSKVHQIKSTVATQQDCVKEMNSKLAAHQDWLEEVLHMAALLGIY
ncbi:hypothetical protein TW65_09361 [Stemphylium lycopersici]|nr:hypothetical protein TW65_09361 [Stemphylium lycopersici]